MYNEVINTAQAAGANSSRELFEGLLKDEEGHVDFLEAQMHQIEQLGYERYLAQQIEGSGSQLAGRRLPKNRYDSNRRRLARGWPEQFLPCRPAWKSKPQWSTRPRTASPPRRFCWRLTNRPAHRLSVEAV